MGVLRVDDLSRYLSFLSQACLIYYRRERNKNYNDLLSYANKMNLKNKLAYSSQVHCNQIAKIKSPGMIGEYDSLITNKRGIVLAIQVADCFPIYLADKSGTSIGLIHAGWKGSYLGITKDTITLMKEDFHIAPADILTFIGPSIRSCCYEVGDEVVERFHSKHLIRNKNNRYSLDLVGVNLDQLKTAGVKNYNISIDKRCTSCSQETLHSFRRDGEKSGRNICFISHKGLLAN